MGRFTGRLLSALRVVGVVAAVVMSSILAAQTVAAAQAGDERIESYDVEIAIQRDASMLVTERILYNFDSNQRHGIFHEIPVLFPYSKRYDRYYPLDVLSVESPDAPAQYTVDNTGSSVIIKIGDPSQTVTGVHTYILTYLVRQSLTAYRDYDELYWNVTGNQWSVPIDIATVRVTAPAPPTAAACWAGPYGSASQCEQGSAEAGDATFTQNGLGPYEGLTVAVKIPKAAVATPHPVLRERWSLQQAFALTPVSVGAFGGLLAVMVILGALVLARRQHRQHGMAAADLTGAMPAPSAETVPLPARDQPAMESAPPGDLRPGQAGTLLDGVANPRDVTATIVDLAVRGYLRIEDTGWEAASRDWRLARLDKNGGLLDYEQILLDGLFMNAATDCDVPSVRLSELGGEFAAQLKRAQGALYTDVTKRGWFITRPDQARRKWLALGLAMFGAGVIAVIVAAAKTHLGIVPIPLVLAGLALAGAAKWMPARTPAGAAMARRVEGFRSYITTAAVAQAHPAGQPDALYDYLPYAIAFGCTQEWADLTGSLAHTGPAPSWYHASAPPTPGNLASLTQSSHYFSAMHHFATTANNWVATAGSGSGGSAFSGGGFSGGGGGGSW